MINIKKAVTAYNETKWYREIRDLRETIESEVEAAIKRGEFQVSVDFSKDIPDSTRNAVRKELVGLGYAVGIPAYEESPPEIYYDMATISWRLDDL